MKPESLDRMIDILWIALGIVGCLAFFIVGYIISL